MSPKFVLDPDTEARVTKDVKLTDCDFRHDSIWDTIHSTMRVLYDSKTHDVWRWAPVPVEEWLMGKRYLNLEGSIRRSVKEDIIEFFKAEKGNPWKRVYDEGIFCEGIGSGKSFKTSCIATYFLHLLLCLRNPQRFFECDQSSKLAIMNMCFAGDQSIRKEDGTETTFKQLFDSQETIKVTALDLEKDQFVKVEAKPVVSTGKKFLKKIRFGNGRVLRITANHPLLTKERDKKGRYVDKPTWKPAGEMNVGDVVRVGTFIAEGKPSGYTSDEIKMLAYIFGDTKIYNKGIQFISSYKRIVTDFKETAKRFGVDKFKEHDKGDLHCVIAESPQIVNLIARAKVGALEGERTIPPELIQAPDQEVCLFLNRLWATYGSVNIGHKLSINFTNPSLSFIRAVVDMLSRFGIISRYYTNTGKYKKEKEAEVYRVSISDTQSKQAFMDKIGRYGLRLEGCQMVKGNMGRRFEWTHIERIEDVKGDEEVFDIEVPVHHNLVVNGIVCHNSISERNARSVIFSEIKSKIANCEWFNEREWHREDSRMPDPNCMSELRFKNNIFIIPGSSSWRSAVGYNIIVGIIDEAGSYRATDNSDQAEDIYLTLKRRLGSRFESRGAIIIAGSPMYESDFLEVRIEQGEKDERSYTMRRPLWDAKYPDWQGDFFYVDRVNNLMTDDPPKDMTDVDKIPKVPFLYEAFRANVTKAYRDFGARPSSVIHGFFENPKILMERINRERKDDPIDRLGRFKEWFKPLTYFPSHCIHVDLALSGDACGLSMGHFNGLTKEGGVKVYIDLMMRLTGTKENKIDISKVREYIYALTQLGFKIALVTYDGFQSADSIQILTKKGYRVELLSVDRTIGPYTDLKEAINTDRLDYYYVPSGIPEKPSASEVFVKEAMRLEEIEGKKVDHPPKGSKDVADSVAGVVHNIVKNHQSFIGVRAKII